MGRGGFRDIHKKEAFLSHIFSPMSNLLIDNIIMVVKSTLEKSTTAELFIKSHFMNTYEQTGQVNRTGLSCRIDALDGP